MGWARIIGAMGIVLATAGAPAFAQDDATERELLRERLGPEIPLRVVHLGVAHPRHQARTRQVARQCHRPEPHGEPDRGREHGPHRRHPGARR